MLLPGPGRNYPLDRDTEFPPLDYDPGPQEPIEITALDYAAIAVIILIALGAVIVGVCIWQ